MLDCTFVQVTVDNSRDKRISDCMACQVLLYSKTNMLVGLHGAGEDKICNCRARLLGILPTCSTLLRRCVVELLITIVITIFSSCVSYRPDKHDIHAPGQSGGGDRGPVRRPHAAPVWLPRRPRRCIRNTPLHILLRLERRRGAGCRQNCCRGG